MTADRQTVTVELAADEVLVALKRGEEYEDVHPELVSEDAIGDRWPEYRTIHPASQAPAEAPEIGEVTWQQAADAIDNLDDYARMMVGVDPSGPRETLYRFLEQTKAALASKAQPKGTATARDGWKHDCAALLTNDVELWVDRCPHCGKPAPAAATQAPAPAPEVKAKPLAYVKQEQLDILSRWGVAGLDASEESIGFCTVPIFLQAPAVRDEPQDIGGHIRAAASARVAQQADDDTKRMDYLQQRGATVHLIPSGHDSNGQMLHSFCIGGLHRAVSKDIREAIDAAISLVPVQGSE